MIEVYFYSITIFIIAKYALHLDVSIDMAINPIGTNLYWFATTYIFVMILSPVIKWIIKINIRISLTCTAISLILYSIIPLIRLTTSEPNCY